MCGCRRVGAAGRDGAVPSRGAAGAGPLRRWVPRRGAGNCALSHDAPAGHHPPRRGSSVVSGPPAGGGGPRSSPRPYGADPPGQARPRGGSRTSDAAPRPFGADPHGQADPPGEAGPSGEGRPGSGRHGGPGAKGDGEVRRVAAATFAGVCAQPFAGGEGPAYAAALLAVLGLTALCDAALAAALGAARTGHPYAPALRDEVRALAGMASAVCAGGVVMALAVATAGLWALPMAAAPLLLAQMSLRGQAAVRATYRQTIGSLARATEVAGYTPEGHARRVSELATAVGRELGLPARHLMLLEYAALMHDIGQLSLVDPVPRGATEPLDGERQRAIAALGGEVVRQTGAPAEVALIVERQAHPYREQPLAGRIVRAVNAYEDLTGEPGAALGHRLAAVERLRLATAREYDPQVVAALTRVLARRPTWAWLDAHGSGKGVE
ncbi:HD-GYP domain-containing protein [Streptomyces sp. NPDC093221]|uniref:HD-GYP domain-containing protein n=1 Tax=Streptomyces sp. NPDC093221 TaxID=3366032 RepID=UPI003809766C